MSIIKRSFPEEIRRTMSLILITPDTWYEQAFAAMTADYAAHHERGKYESFKPALEDFPAYVRSKLDESEGVGLQTGYVRGLTYWLTDETRTIYGTIRYRPVLNEPLSKIGGHIGFDIAPTHRKKGFGTVMLGLLLQKIDKRENSRVLLTCDAGNIGSRKIIEHNGGKPEQYGGESRQDVLRYWIEIL